MSGMSIIQQFLQNNKEDERLGIRQKREDKQRGEDKQHEFDKMFTRAALDEDTFKDSLGKETEELGKRKRQGKDIDLEYADREAQKAGDAAAIQHLATKYGISPKDAQEAQLVKQEVMKQFLAESAKSQQEAKTGALKSNIEEEGLNKTRNTAIERLLSQSQEGAYRAGQSKKFAEQNPDALQAGMLGQELAPASALARANTISVGQGDYLKRLTTGNSSFDKFFPGQEGRGGITSETTKMVDIGGQQFPIKGQSYTPGDIKPVYSGKLSDLLGGGQPTSNVQQAPSIKPPMQQVTPPRSMPGRSSGGQSMNTTLPPEMLNAQPTKEQQTEEVVRKLLQRMWMEPKF